jgi:uncharacterized membrane protein YccF (DUF307 family)
MLHIGHARNEVEAALTIIGFAITLLGLGVAAMTLWPRSIGTERHRRTARRRALHEEEERPFGEHERDY